MNVGDPCYQSFLFSCFDSSPDADTGNIPLTINVRVTQEGDVIAGTAPVTVTFEPDSLWAFLTITTDDDSAVEPTGKIEAKILNGSGYSPLYVGLAEVPEDHLPLSRHLVFDNDLTFSVGDAQAAEDAGTMDFTVSLNASSTEDVSVDVTTVDGDATSHGNVTATSLGRDFTARTETITFLTGEQTRTFTVTLEDDSIQEKDETFTVRLSNSPEYTTLARDSAAGTIEDDERSMVASVSRAYSIVDEDHEGPVMFTVELTHPDTTNHERNPAVTWRVIAGTAGEGDDYVAAGGRHDFPLGPPAQCSRSVSWTTACSSSPWRPSPWSSSTRGRD